MTSASMKFLPSSMFVRNALATIPLAILLHDNLFSLYRVKGSSMEPSLQDGDVVVVRKADGIWQRWTQTWPIKDNVNNNNKNSNSSSNNNNKKIGDNDADNTNPSISPFAWAIERGDVLEYEMEHCRSSPRTGWLRTPPVPVTGNIVVFQDPETYPSQWNIKRVIGLGGQVVLVNRHQSNSDKTAEKRRKTWNMDEYMSGMTIATTSVSPYSIWVQGDNATDSRDSGTYGAVSKKLLVGIAEYRVWPPWRLGRLDNSSASLLLPVTDEATPHGSGDNQHPLSPPKYRSRSYWPWKQE
ncbi:signal peptidase I [Nitzschia inconspicua]|uniref:Mitochondrial inner membrane protease subunit n=1 Tax=Nitzschia inconspicua TaxID=303405 RepID=A0A9K3PEJ5_9STRA|nr:signal peptidase I [Nitzschia inconspicua]